MVKVRSTNTFILHNAFVFFSGDAPATTAAAAADDDDDDTPDGYDDDENEGADDDDEPLLIKNIFSKDSGL